MGLAFVWLSVWATQPAAQLPETDRVSVAKQGERAEAPPITAFFFARPPSGAAPGTLIRSESFTGYDVPDAVAVTRILYVSQSELGHATVASAVVVAPARAAPPGGWPVVLWAHGTTGVARQCGPSVTRHIGYYTDDLAMHGTARGFAVVAIDYSGLSSGRVHEYLWKKSNANDAIFAIAPARRAVASLSKTQWVAVGHSQGGQTVWGVAEAMATARDPSYLGGVALAPGVNSRALIEHIAATAGETFYPVYVAYGIKAVYPSFAIAAMLKRAGLTAYEPMTGGGCFDLANAEFRDTQPGAVLRPDWTESLEVQKYLAANAGHGRSIAGPLLVASATRDNVVPPSLIEPEVRDLCETGAIVDYRKYDGNHKTILAASLDDLVDWIMDRFSGRPAPNTCSSLR